MGEGMKRGLTMFKSILVIGLVLVLGTLAYCQDIFFPYTWHQKMTVEVEVDGQVYTGSSVVRVSWRKNDPIGAANGPTWISGTRGEAPFVEIPGYGVLFTLLSFFDNTAYAADIATRVMSGRMGWTRGKEEFAAVQDAEGQMLTVTEAHYPLLVTFTDVNDPKSVKKMAPDNLAATFGPGVSLKRITLEITDEPVTVGKIESVLGWWNNLTEPIGGKVNRKYGDPLYGLGKWSFVRR